MPPKQKPKYKVGWHVWQRGEDNSGSRCGIITSGPKYRGARRSDNSEYYECWWWVRWYDCDKSSLLSQQKLELTATMKFLQKMNAMVRGTRRAG